MDTVPLMLKYRVVDVLFETLLRRQPDSVVCSALSLIGAVNRFPPLKERLLQLFDEAAASKIP